MKKLIENRILETPAELKELHPLSQDDSELIGHSRQQTIDVLSGKDSRLLAIIGPCSMDKTTATECFWEELQPVAEKVSDHVMTVLRAPVAKPRTIGGWRGIEQDSLELARKQLVRLARLGAPVAIELLEPRHTALFGDALSLGWVGARNASNMALRLEASRNPDLPVLFKNSVEGSVAIPAEARSAVSMQHENVDFLGEDGRMWQAPKTPGNPNTVTILRGAQIDRKVQSNINLRSIREAATKSEELGLSGSVILDLAHSNASAETSNLKSSAGQLLAFEKASKLICDPMLSKIVLGVMAEATLEEGTGHGFGFSKTDPTINIDNSKEVLLRLAKLTESRST